VLTSIGWNSTDSRTCPVGSKSNHPVEFVFFLSELLRGKTDFAFDDARSSLLPLSASSAGFLD
jgi:hypothetical protein